ncbi:hypothetical protein ZWY2020_026768 [Hordeum vulgare]|nr:hypothetical protein ZWY2020_026768 [Hordeum vulgare]
MVSWSEGSHSSSSDSDISSPAPPSILCVEWTGLATDLSARCEHQAICEKYVAFQSVDSGRRFLGCAQKVTGLTGRGMVGKEPVRPGPALFFCLFSVQHTRLKVY